MATRLCVCAALRGADAQGPVWAVVRRVPSERQALVATDQAVEGLTWRGGVRERRVSFFNIEPEASGSPAVGTSPGTVACVFDTWLGDDLIRAYPALLVTTPVKRALLRLQQPTGFEITRARIRTSGFFRQHSPGKRLPAFWAIQARGHAGRDDMGLTAAGTPPACGHVRSSGVGLSIAGYTGQRRRARWAVLGGHDEAMPC